MSYETNDTFHTEASLCTPNKVIHDINKTRPERCRTVPFTCCCLVCHYMSKLQKIPALVLLCSGHDHITMFTLAGKAFKGTIIQFGL